MMHLYDGIQMKMLPNLIKMKFWSYSQMKIC